TADRDCGAVAGGSGNAPAAVRSLRCNRVAYTGHASGPRRPDPDARGVRRPAPATAGGTLADATMPGRAACAASRSGAGSVFLSLAMTAVGEASAMRTQ